MSSYGSLPSSGCHNASGCFVQRLHKDESNLPLVAVIVTIKAGSSYDHLFAAEQQEAPAGGRVSTFQMELNRESMLALLAAFDNRAADNRAAESLRELMADVDAVARNSVVFNFECSSSCSECGFVDGALSGLVVRVIDCLLSAGFMVMASDFALKALIAKWDGARLGPCPFVQAGTFQSSCVLRFVPGVLKECPSAQLVAVGRLCEEKAEASVRALSGTIAVALADGVEADNAHFSLEVLTVQSQLDGTPVTADRFPLATKRAHAARVDTHVGTHVGMVGHALLRFKGRKGGMLLVASTHWIELARLETNSEAVFRAFELHQGREYAAQRRAEYGALPEAARAARVQDYAHMIVQRAAPCSYSSIPS